MIVPMKRLFIAVELPDNVLCEIARIQRYFQKKHLFEGRYPDIAAMHLTLKFIGEVPMQQVAAIARALRAIAANSLRAQLDAINFFGSPESMKVLFVSCSCPGLAELVHDIEERLSDFVTPEKRDYEAHITIARVKQVFDAASLVEAIELCPLEPIIFTINSFVLKQSMLLRDGPEHSDVERYCLGK